MAPYSIYPGAAVEAAVVPYESACSHGKLPSPVEVVPGTEVPASPANVLHNSLDDSSPPVQTTTETGMSYGSPPGDV